MRTAPCLVQRCLYGLIAASTVVLLSAPLSAADAASDSPTIVVRYSARDLATEASAKLLLHRIEIAAHELCLDQNFEPLALHMAARRCYLAAVERAVDAVNAPRVHAAYAAKYGPATPAAEAKARGAGVAQHSGQG